MVNQPISVESEPPVSGDPNLPPLEIEDTTEGTQLTRETAILEGRDPDALESKGQVAGTEEPPVGGVGEEPQPQANEDTLAPTETEEARINRLIDSRTRGMQSNYDKQIAAAQKTARLAEEKNQEADIAARVEVELRRQTTELSESMGPEAARDYVRSEANEKLVSDSFIQTARNTQLEKQAHQSGMETRANQMVQWAGKLKDEYNLGDEDLMAIAETVQLESLNTQEGFEAAGVAMHNLASRMGTSTKPDPTTQVPREQPGNVPGTGRSTSNAPTSDTSLQAAARDKPAWQWTDAEHAAMRRSTFGG
jgi:hypothetical protein